MALKLDEPPQDYDDNQPSWQTNLNGDGDDLESMYSAPDATDENLPPGHPSRTEGAEPAATDEAGSPDSYTPSELQDAESEVGPSEPGYGVQSEYDRLPGGSESSIPYTPDTNERLRDKAKLLLVGRSRVRQTFGGGLFAGGIAGLIISLFTLLLPLKLEHFLQNIQAQYFSNSQNAVSQRAEQLLISYFKTALIPNMTPGGTCGSTKTITKECVVLRNSPTPAGRLYGAWRDKRFENILANKYGIELEKGTGGGASGVRLKVKGLPDIDFEDFSDGSSSDAARINRTNYKRAINKALQDESRLKRMYLRFKVGGLLERKYGINRCLVACDTRNRLTSKTKQAKRLAKLTVVNRVITPRSDSLGLILTCIIDTSSDGCNTDPEIDDPENDSERRTALEREIRQFAERAGREVSEESIQKAVDVIDEINGAGGYTEFIAKKIGAKLAGEVGEKVAVNAIPVVGWINLAASLIYKSAEVSKFIRYASYAQHATEAVTVYTTWVSFNDEIKAGFGDSTLVGSMAGALSNGIGDTPSAQSGELSPMWGDVSNTTQTTMMDALFPSVFAQATQKEKPKYTCDDGNPPPAGKKICPEEDFRANNIFEDVANFWSGSPQNVLAGAAEVWNRIVGVGGKAVEAVFSVPPISDAVASLNGVIAPVANWFTDQIGTHLIKSAVSESMSGARLVQVLIAGGNVSANESEKALGAPPVSAGTADSYRRYHREEQRKEFAQKPLKDRLFAADDSQSLLSHIAFSTPTDTTSFSGNTIATLFSNPFATIGNSFASAFGSNRAYAQQVECENKNPDGKCTDVVTEDPFGIPQFAYAPNSATFRADPETYTPEYCADLTKRWNESFSQDPATGQMIPTIENPCLLEKAAVTAAGGFFDSSLIDPEDLGQASATDPGSVPGNANIAIFGDSLTQGMRDQGELASKLQTAGWQPVKIEATQGDKVSDVLPKIDANRDSIISSGTVMVALGTNPAPDTPGFASQVTEMVSKIKQINPTAKIYWMNVATRVSQYNAVNSAISSQAGTLGYSVIDWQKEFNANGAAYPLGGDGVHHTPAGFKAKSDFTVRSLGPPPSAGGGPSSFSYAEYANLPRDQLVQRLLASPNWKPQSNRPTQDVQNGIAKDDLVRLLVAIVEKANVVISPSVIKTGHSDCSASGNTSNHFGGYAIDIGNEDVAPALVPWLYQNKDALGLNELIINPVPAGAKNLDEGKDHNYDAATMRGHADHIHISVKGPRVLSSRCGGN